jgi:hypothetical protein
MMDARTGTSAYRLAKDRDEIDVPDAARETLTPLTSAPSLQGGEYLALFWCATCSACCVRKIDVLSTRIAKGEYKMTECIISLLEQVAVR